MNLTEKHGFNSSTRPVFLVLDWGCVTLQIVHVNQRNSSADFKSYGANIVFKIWADFTLRSTSYKTLQYV